MHNQTEEQTLEELYRLKRPAQSAPKGKKRFRWVQYAAIIFLGVACIGGMELLACRLFEPALYEDIMEPVRERAYQVSQAASVAWDGVCRTGTALAERTEAAAAAAGDSIHNWIEELIAVETEPEADSALAQPEIEPPSDLLDPLISDIVERDGLEYLTGGGIEVVYYNQTDEARSEQKYGSDLLSTHGCGPTAMAMAVASLTGEPVDPEDMAQLCVNQGYWCKNHGSYLSIVQGIAGTYGLNCESLDTDTLNADDLYLRLSVGYIAVALMTKGHFTKGGHFILLRGTTLSGEILVADPASRDRSLIPWELSMILDELSPSRHDGAPLWILSKAPE